MKRKRLPAVVGVSISFGVLLSIIFLGYSSSIRHKSFKRPTDAQLITFFEETKTTSASNSAAPTPTDELAPDTPAEETPIDMRLNRTPATADLTRAFDSANRESNQFAETGFQLLESVAWFAKWGTRKGLAYRVGSEKLRNGNMEDARDYYFSALSAHLDDDDSYWGDLYAQLAWVEEDPEIAVRYIEKSLDLPDDAQKDVLIPIYLSNAIELAVATDSQDLAEHYYTRWKAADKEDWVDNFDAYPTVKAWVNEHHPEDVTEK